MAVPPTLTDTARQTTAFLLDYCAARQAEAAALHPAYGRLWQSLAHQLQHGGKRLRPYLFLLGYAAGGGTKFKRLVPAAAAWELLHLGLLVHDDVIDRDLTRHGQPNVSGEYLAHYAHLPAAARRHQADAAALLAGDLALNAAQRVVLDSTLNGRSKLAVCRQLGEALFTVVGGELLDTEAAHLPVGEVDPAQIAEYKTASYSFVGPLVSGASLAGAPLSVQAGLSTYGRALGIGYQLADDLLSTFGDPAITGKPADSDLREAKRSAVLVRGLALMPEKQRREAKRLLAQPVPLDDGSVRRLRELLVGCGVQVVLESELDRLHRIAEQALTALALAAPLDAALHQMTDMALYRIA